jgi:alpha-glucosidase
MESRWDAAVLRRVIAEYEASIPAWGWPNWVIGSHDAPRIAARKGEAQARVAAMLLLTLRGTPTVYQGDELGIGKVAIPPDRIRDPRELREPGRGLNRDPSRTPMPWDDGPQAGFTTAAETWLPLNDDWPTRNVAAQERDPGSVLHLHRALLALRRARPALALGDLRLIDAAEGVLAYERTLGGERLGVALNFTAEPKPSPFRGEVLLSTLAGTSDELRGNEGVVIAL